MEKNFVHALMCMLVFVSGSKAEDPNLYWSMDTDSIIGKTLLPDIGNTSNWSGDLGKINGTKQVDGYKGRALLLDSNSITIGSSTAIRRTCLFYPSLCDGGGVTVSMWLQVQQWTNSFAAIFETGAKDFPLYTGVGIYPQNYPPRCRAAVLTSEGIRYYASFQQDLIGRYHWTHLTMTWSEGNGVKVYINGTEISSYMEGPATETKNPMDTNLNLVILGNARMQMYVDELKIWYQELSADEVMNEATGQFSSSSTVLPSTEAPVVTTSTSTMAALTTTSTVPAASTTLPSSATSTSSSRAPVITTTLKPTTSTQAEGFWTTGTIIAVSVGAGVALLALIIAIIVCCCLVARRRKEEKEKSRSAPI